MFSSSMSRDSIFKYTVLSVVYGSSYFAPRNWDIWILVYISLSGRCEDHTILDAGRICSLHWYIKYWLPGTHMTITRWALGGLKDLKLYAIIINCIWLWRIHILSRNSKGQHSYTPTIYATMDRGSIHATTTTDLLSSLMYIIQGWFEKL